MLNSTSNKDINPHETHADPEVNRKNILAVQEYAINSRKIVRELETKVNQYQKENEMLSSKLEGLESQVKAMQVRLFSGVATNGN